MVRHASYGWGRHTRSPARFRTRRRPVRTAYRGLTASRRGARTGRANPPSSRFPDAGPRLEQAPILSAVDCQGRPGDEAGGIARQEDDRGRQLVGPAVAAQWDVSNAAPRELPGVDTELDRLVPVLFPDAIGLEAAGQDGIHSDLGRRLFRESLSHGGNRRPQCVRKDEIVDRLMRGDRGEIDDGASTAPQRRKGGAREANSAHEHEVEGFRPRVVVELCHGAEDRPPGVVDEDLEATQFGDRPLNEVAALVGFPDIGDPRYDVIALIA